MDSQLIVKEKYVAVLFYIGHGYSGWQKQSVGDDGDDEVVEKDEEEGEKEEKEGGKRKKQRKESKAEEGKEPITIQKELEEAVKKAVTHIHTTNNNSNEVVVGISACASGRTDAGTHASGQVVHFIVKYHKSDPLIQSRHFASPPYSLSQWDEHCSLLMRHINLHLPEQIVVQKLFHFPTHFPTVNEFHARGSAQWKQYSFYLQQGDVFMVDWAPFCFFFKEKINLLKSELATIKGEHDFKNFVNDHKNIPVKTRLIIDQIEISILQKLRPYKTFPTCTVRSYETNNNNGEITNRPTFGYDHKQPPIAPNMEQPYVIRIRIVGSGFLRHMVRRIVGSLLLVARGKAEPGIFVRVLHDGVGSEGDRENDNSEKQPEKGKAKEVEGEKGSNEKENRSAIRRKRNQHRAEKEKSNAPRKEILGPAVAARGLWLDRVWYGGGLCVDPSPSPSSSSSSSSSFSSSSSPSAMQDGKLQPEFTPFVDCVFSTNV